MFFGRAVNWMGLKTFDFRGQGAERQVGFAYNHAPLYERSDDNEEDSYLNVASIYKKNRWIWLLAVVHCQLYLQ